ncbi:MAG: hypothetical protein D6734_02285 [Candidatus Schekmanbacteria bacterium]|nr:MAG: hypothetical protein D6734_02285 [Candidatus Schekmanbacteria bacterium]
MKNSTKAVILSGLAFPGLGQIVMKCYVKGISFIIATLTGLIVFLVKAVRISLSILDKISAEGNSIDIAAITDAANRAVKDSDSQILKYSLFFIILCWAVSIIDAYITGRKKDLGKKE